MYIYNIIETSYGIFNKLLDIHINIWYNIIVRNTYINIYINTQHNGGIYMDMQTMERRFIIWWTKIISWVKWWTTANRRKWLPWKLYRATRNTNTQGLIGWLKKTFLTCGAFTQWPQKKMEVIVIPLSIITISTEENK